MQELVTSELPWNNAPVAWAVDSKRYTSRIYTFSNPLPFLKHKVRGPVRTGANIDRTGTSSAHSPVFPNLGYLKFRFWHLDGAASPLTYSPE